jgi:hypothetical protein
VKATRASETVVQLKRDQTTVHADTNNRFVQSTLWTMNTYLLAASIQESTLTSDEWRRYGKARRKQLVEMDELEGGVSFHINKKVRIHRYFRLAERVSCTQYSYASMLL